MDNNEIIKFTVEAILKHANPERIYLFGSQVSGEAKQESDIDIAFYDPACKSLELIKEEIEKLRTLVKVDVTNIAFTEERFRDRVKITGKVLYSASKKLRAEDALYNFEKALNRLIAALDNNQQLKNDGYEDFLCDLLVKRFEFTYEMAWKSIKRYLDLVGISALNPRSCFKEAYAQKIITEQEIWLEMIESRNLSSHVYDANQITPILGKIDSYKTAFMSLQCALKDCLAVA
jgi:nucleotidyltransferase substrate binding protein (TIGR01987 family)